jgi:hypothetical protein
MNDEMTALAGLPPWKIGGEAVDSNEFIFAWHTGSLGEMICHLSQNRAHHNVRFPTAGRQSQSAGLNFPLSN